MSEELYLNSTGMESLLNGSLNEISELRNQVIKISNQNDEYQQTIHVLRRELDSTNAMYKEVKELLEEVSNQQTEKINQITQEITDKHNEERKYFKNRINELEDALVSKESEFYKLEKLVEDLQNRIRMPPIQEELEETICFETLKPDESKIKEVMIVCQEKNDKIIELEKNNSNLQNQISELQDIVQSIKKRIQEKDQIIENTQEELAECRLELNTLKTAPVAGSQKGNSLFAEVEDRRKIMMDKMNTMRSSYHEMKRSFVSKENEIKALRTERAALIRKWEDTSIEAVEQEANLVDAYKNRIADLEKRLKDEQKKNKQMQKEQQSDSNISYFQTVLKSKKKEIEELQIQIENNSILTLLKEETSHKLANRLRYWRYKAMSLEANLLAVQSQLQADSNSSTMEILQLIKNQMSDKTLTIDDTEDAIEMSLKPQIVDETCVSLESLIQPIPLYQPNLNPPLSSETSKTFVTKKSTPLESSNLTIPTTCPSNAPNPACKTLNFTKDMSMTEVIQPKIPNNILKFKIHEDSLNLHPTSKDMSITEVIESKNPKSNSKFKIDEDFSNLHPTSKDMSITEVIETKNLNSTLKFKVHDDSSSLHLTSKDMSMTEVIQSKNPNSTSKIEVDEDFSNFKPISKSTGLEEYSQNISLAPNTNYNLNKENIATAGSSSNLKSALSKSKRSSYEQKVKKTLRFAADTAQFNSDSKGFIKRLKENQRKYPIVHISSTFDNE